MRNPCFRKDCNPYEIVIEKILHEIALDPNENVTCIDQVKDNAFIINKINISNNIIEKFFLSQISDLIVMPAIYRFEIPNNDDRCIILRKAIGIESQKDFKRKLFTYRETGVRHYYR